MPGGRPPKPIEQKRRTGNPGKRALPAKATTTALEPSAGAPVPIALGDEGRAKWVELQGSATWLATVDHMALESACHLWDEVQEMRRRIAEEGLTVVEPIVTPAGLVVGERMVAHPLLKELRAAEKQLTTLGSALGFDPTSRARLGLAEVKTRSILQELVEAPRQAQVIDIAADD